jgi:hypothetical protein
MFRVGDYARVKHKVSPVDCNPGTTLKIVRIVELPDRIEVQESEAAEVYLEGEDNKNYYAPNQLEVIPKEIYQSPLFKVMNEDE